MYTLAKKVRDLEPYTPVEGRFRIHLDANESFLSLPDPIREKIARKVAALPFNRYPDPLAKELSEKYAAVYGLDPACLTVGDGSDELISMINGCLLEKSDKVMTFSDDFSMYAFYSFLSEHPSLVLQKEEGFRIDVDKALDCIKKENVRAIIFSNPCNPTGRGLSKDEVRRLITGTDALVVLDEAYMDFWDQSLLPEVAEYDNLIILKTLSKAFGLAGLRVGFAAANPTLTRALQAVKSPYNVGLLPQAAASAVLEEPGYLENCVRALIQSREELETGLKALSAAHPDKIPAVYPSVTNFVLLSCPEADKVTAYLAGKGIAVRKFPGHLRISGGAPEENRELLAALKGYLEGEGN